MGHFELIAVIIVLAGLLGGITNFYLLYKIEFTPKEARIHFFKSLLLSLCASATVPLFLQVISNNLMDLPDSGSFPVKNYFILGGFCVLAAFYSKRFLDDLYSKVNKAEEKAEEAKKAVAQVELRNQEVDSLDNFGDNVIFQVADKEFQKDHINGVVKAIVQSKYTYRTINGIAKETDIPLDEVTKILKFMLDNNLAERARNSEGKEIWRIKLSK